MVSLSFVIFTNSLKFNPSKTFRTIKIFNIAKFVEGYTANLIYKQNGLIVGNQQQTNFATNFAF